MKYVAACSFGKDSVATVSLQESITNHWTKWSIAKSCSTMK